VTVISITKSGSEVFITGDGTGGSGTFAIVSETAGTFQQLPKLACADAVRSADSRPDGRMVGLTNDALLEFNPRTGECRKFADTPEALSAIAVAPDGEIYGVSVQTRFGEPRLLRFDAAGKFLSAATMSGAVSASGIDFAPDGRLYGVGFTATFGGLYEIDKTTGRVSLLSTAIDGIGDIDIDSSGTLRTTWFGELNSYILASRSKITSRTLETGNFFSALVTAPPPSRANTVRLYPITASASNSTVWAGTSFTGSASFAIDRIDGTAWTSNRLSRIQFEFGADQTIVAVQIANFGNVSNGHVVNIYVGTTLAAKAVALSGATSQVNLSAEAVGRSVTVEMLGLPHNEFGQIATWSEIAEFSILVRSPSP
jgi:hypothetical protein